MLNRIPSGLLVWQEWQRLGTFKEDDQNVWYIGIPRVWNRICKGFP